MSKKKKTLKQKIVADLRHSQYRLETADSFEPVEPPSIKQSPKTYAYLYSDLRKTSTISLLIVASQILLYFLLTKDILVLPFIRY